MDLVLVLASGRASSGLLGSTSLTYQIVGRSVAVARELMETQAELPFMVRVCQFHGIVFHGCCVVLLLLLLRRLRVRAACTACAHAGSSNKLQVLWCLPRPAPPCTTMPCTLNRVLCVV